MSNSDSEARTNTFARAATVAASSPVPAGGHEDSEEVRRNIRAVSAPGEYVRGAAEQLLRFREDLAEIIRRLPASWRAGHTNAFAFEQVVTLLLQIIAISLGGAREINDLVANLRLGDDYTGVPNVVQVARDRREAIVRGSTQALVAECQNLAHSVLELTRGAADRVFITLNPFSIYTSRNPPHSRRELTQLSLTVDVVGGREVSADDAFYDFVDQPAGAVVQPAQRRHEGDGSQEGREQAQRDELNRYHIDDNVGLGEAHLLRWGRSRWIRDYAYGLRLPVVIRPVPTHDDQGQPLNPVEGPFHEPAPAPVAGEASSEDEA